VAATNALKADNETFRDRLEGQLSEKYEQRRERLLLASVQTLEAMDRAIEAARNSDAAEALISGSCSCAPSSFASSRRKVSSASPSSGCRSTGVRRRRSSAAR
jgi:hypothetical protein